MPEELEEGDVRTHPAYLPLVVRGCSRCGLDHEALIFSLMRQPMRTADGSLFTHWAACPVSGDPILMAWSHTRPPISLQAVAEQAGLGDEHSGPAIEEAQAMLDAALAWHALSRGELADLEIAFVTFAKAVK